MSEPINGRYTFVKWVMWISGALLLTGAGYLSHKAVTSVNAWEVSRIIKMEVPNLPIIQQLNEDLTEIRIRQAEDSVKLSQILEIIQNERE